MAKKPTMHDVAAAAGVSQATVSLVLSSKSGSSRVSRDTADRVREAVRRLGYRTNAHAKMLREGRSRMIGLIGHEIATAPFAGELILGAQAEAWESGHVLLTVDTAGDASLEKAAVEMMLSYRVEGIIYAAMYHQRVSLPASLAGVRTVCANAQDSSGSVTSVFPDEVRGGREAAEALLAVGHRRIGMINLADEGSTLPAAAGRLAGFTQALASAGLPLDPDLLVHGHGSYEAGWAGVAELMTRSEPPTAIFCGTDRTALGAYQALAARGLSVPGDVSIVGFDDQAIIAPLFQPRLTTFQLPLQQIGRRAVDELLHGKDATGQHIPVHCPVRIQSSIAHPKESA